MDYLLIVLLFIFVLYQRSLLRQLQRNFSVFKKSVLKYMDDQKLPAIAETAEPRKKYAGSASLDHPSVDHIQPQPAAPQTLHIPHYEKSYAEELVSKYRYQLDWAKENWTGLFGVSILVLGVAFIQVYLSVQLGPLIRFISLFSTALLLLATSIYLQRRFESWKDLASWLQAASGAIVLLACAGSSYFDALRFYESPDIGLSLFIGGIVANLLIARFNPLTYAATFGVILNYLALFLAPHSLLIQYVVFITTFFSFLIIFKKSTIIHLAIISSVYAIFDYAWAYGSFPQGDWMHFLSTGFILGLVPLGFYFHQEKIRKNPQEEINALTATSLLLLWGVLAIQTLLWCPYPLLTIGLLGGFGVLLGVTALLNQKSLSPWKTQIHLLVSMLYGGLSIYQLIDFDLSSHLIFSIFIAEIILFCSIFSSFNYRPMTGISHGLLVLSLTIFAVSTIADMPILADSDWKTLIQTAKHHFYVIMGLIFILSGAFFQTRRVSSGTVSHHPLWQGYYSTLLFLTLYVSYNLIPFYFGSIVLTHCLVQRYLFTPTENLSSILGQSSNLLMILMFSLIKISVPELSVAPKALYFVGGLLSYLLLLSPNVLLLPKKWIGRFDGWLYGLTAYAICSILLITKGISDFLPGIFLLIISIILMEFRQPIAGVFKGVGSNTPFMGRALHNSIMGILIAFTALHLTVHVQSYYYISPYLSLTSILAALGIPVFALSIYYSYSPFLYIDRGDETGKSETITDRIFQSTSTRGYELILILLVMTISLEVPVYMQILVFSLLTLGLAWLPKMLETPPRIHIYAWIAFLTSSLHLAIVTSRWNSPLQTWYSDTHLTGIFGILILFLVGHVLIESSEKEDKDHPKTPTVILGVIPIFVLSALFFYWRFDLAYLTTLFVLLCLIMIGMGFYWRNIRVIQIAYTSLAACVIRLIFFDLRESDMLIRALVFIAVGGMMIMAQMMYKKFHYRLLK